MEKQQEIYNAQVFINLVSLITLIIRITRINSFLFLSNKLNKPNKLNTGLWRHERCCQLSERRV